IHLNRSTVSSIVNQLIQAKMARETKLEHAAMGRPGMLLALDPEGGCAVGVDINVDFIAVALSDFVGAVLWRQHVSSNPADSQDAVLAQAETMAHQALERGARRGLRPLGIGVGLPGMVDTTSGQLVFAPNLGWSEAPVGRLWSERFHLPVFVENEANAAALGELCFGAARGVRNMIYLSHGAGLGGGIIMDGKLFRGAGGAAGEIGHIKASSDGELCGCGKRGCWETQVGTHTVVRRAQAALLERQGGAAQTADNGHLTFASILRKAEEGDPTMLGIVRRLGEQLGEGIANLVNIFNPDMVVLGGELSGAGPALMPIVEQAVAARALQQPLKNLRIETSAHGGDACVIGALALVLDAVMRDPLLTMDL
ncbi:MAG: ROK family protein, partial [Candidatus Sumerlaeota bacterium]|nr:ROK family protein [Candidatus Sumerlaeota bacterium]